MGSEAQIKSATGSGNLPTSIGSFRPASSSYIWESSRPMKKPESEKPATSQVEKFRELAREIETVDSEEPLNAAIRKLAKSPPPKDDKAKKDAG